MVASLRGGRLVGTMLFVKQVSTPFSKIRNADGCLIVQQEVASPFCEGLARLNPALVNGREW
jgi:hypothetical protein